MFELVVELYRKIGKPPLTDGGSFSHSGPDDADIRALCEQLQKAPNNFGEMSYFRAQPSGIKFEYNVVTSGENSFFDSFVSLVQKTPSLGSGKHLQNFYITSEDWASFDAKPNPSNNRILKVCDLINDLSKVAASEHPQNNFYNLVFSTPTTPNKPPKTIVIQTKLTESIIELNLNKTSLIHSLANEEHKGRIHLEERRAILNGAICESLESLTDGQANKFMHILQSWDSIIENYWRNFQIYIHSFSFEKTRKEFAQAELEYGTKLSAAFSDIAGKLLALPVSLIALLTLHKATTGLEEAVTVSGLIITSLILFGILINQYLNVQRLNSSLDASFDNLSKALKTYPKNLQTLIVKSKRNIGNQKKVVTTTLITFSALSFSPSIGAFLILYCKYQAPIHAWIEQHIHRC